jgi:hypothetical protein
MTEDEVLTFVTTAIPSVWALEMLLLMRAAPARSWSVDDLIRESRSSVSAVQEAMSLLSAAGLVAAEANSFRYSPANAALEELAGEIAGLQAKKPTTVVRAILSAPHHKLRSFSDAFKIKE